MRVQKVYKSSNSYEADSDSGDQFTSVKIRGKSISQKGRKKPEHKCLQSNLLYATNLPLWFEDEQVHILDLAEAIKDEKYFGQYGSIIGVMSSTKSAIAHSQDSPKYVQSYITYRDERDVAIVIAAINDMMCFSFSVKTTYGTSRLCNNYVNGKRCTVKGCFWLHDEKNVIKFEGPFRADFEKQRLIAFDIVRKNLSYYIQKIETKKPVSDSAKAKEEPLVRFPTIKETIDKLIQKKILTKFIYEKAYEQYLATKKKMSETVKKIVYVRKIVPLNSEEEPESEKKVKPQPITVQPIKPEPPKEELNIEQVIDKKVNQISTYFQAKKKQKNEFLMSRILESLEGNSDNSPTKAGKQGTAERKKTWEPMLSYTDFFTNKLFEEQDLLDTEESESGDKSTCRQSQQRSLTGPQLQLPYTFDPMMTEQDIEEENKLVDRVKSQILKDRLVKVSMLQFTQLMPFKDNIAQYQKVTKLLKNKLVAWD